MEIESTEYFSMGKVVEPTGGRRKIRWCIAHFPLELFVRAAKAFADKFEELRPGELYFEVHHMQSFLDGYGHTLTEAQNAVIPKMNPPAIANLEDPERTAPVKGKKPADTFDGFHVYWKEMFAALKEQKFEMSQTQINIIGAHLYNPINAIDMPYIFEDHDHVSRVLDGPIGKDISKQMARNTGVTALGYTYSGGYRVIGSTDNITCLDDLNAKNFISFTSPSDMLFTYANVDHISRQHAVAEDLGDMNENGGAIETTYLRFAGKNVLKTNHSMFMTAILSGNAFLESLSAEQLAAFKEAGNHVAKVERLWSVEDAAQYERDAESRGVTIVPINSADEARLRAAAQELHKLENLQKMRLNPNLVEAIVNAKGK